MVQYQNHVLQPVGALSIHGTGAAPCIERLESKRGLATTALCGALKTHSSRFSNSMCALHAACACVACG